MFGGDLNEQSLNQIYDLFSKEQMSLMHTIKTDKDIEDKREKEMHKRLTILNTLMINILRYRNLLKKQQSI
jgi:hypothetical protein